MGDDAAETQSFFLPYCKRNQMEERIRLLLPEFYEAVQMQTVRQPIATWIAWIWPAVLFALFLVAGALLSCLLFSGSSKRKLFWECFIFSIWMILLVLAYFLTAGSTVGVSHMAIVNGYFGRAICYISYKDIQYVEFFTKHICQSGEASKRRGSSACIDCKPETGDSIYLDGKRRDNQKNGFWIGERILRQVL